MLLYSKYSKHCIDLLNIITINEIRGFTNVCIDEPRIRDRILKSPTLQIRQVPCIVTDDRQVYEGELAFRFVNGIIDANASHIPSNSASNTASNTASNSASNSASNTASNTASNSASNTASNSASNTKKTYTSIEDIPDDNSIEDEDTKEDSLQDRYSNAHINSVPELKSRSKKISTIAIDMEKERNATISPPKGDISSMRVSSINDIGLDLTKGRQETPIISIKTGAPINVNKLMATIESR